MSKLELKIESILGGISPSQYFGAKDQYQCATGIDPDMPIDESTVRSSGLLRPTALSKFSSTEITGVPLWIVPSPKGTDTAVYANDGKVHIVASNLTMGTALNSGNALSSSSGNGAVYYDNYWYFAKNTDVARYGPLNGTPSLTQTYWGTTLGLTALTNTTYPSVRGVALPNHVMHRHNDGKVYFADVSGNQGILNVISTSKTTVEGDTNAGSSYNALDFPNGQYVTAIESYGADLAVATIEGTDTTVLQKPAKVSFWDTTSASYSQITDVEFSDPLITALRNVNGILYVFSGNAQGGCRVSKFAGGYTLQEVYYDEDGLPPMQGAVDHLLNRILWGDFTTDPESAAVVKALGSKNRKLMSSGAMHVPFRATSSNTTNQRVTAMKFIQDSSFLKQVPIIGWTDGAAKGLDKTSTTYGTAYWQSQVFRVGRPFTVVSVSIPLATQVAANMTCTPTIYVDDGSSSVALNAISNANYPSMRHIFQTPVVNGKNNLFLELAWSGTALLPISLPIVITIEVEDNGTF